MIFPHFILNESKCRNATISSGIHVFIIGILCLLLLLCMLYFSSALGDVAGLARCSWAGRTSPCSAEPLVSPALWEENLQIQCPSSSGDRKSKLSVRGGSKSLCAWDSAAVKPWSQSLLTQYKSGLRFWSQTGQLDEKCAGDLSAQTWGSSGCSGLFLLAHR